VATTSRGRVVFVEDEETLRRLGETILSRMGFEVSAHEDAESALVSIQEGGLVLLATDMSLPGMSGVQLAHQIRALGYEVPILLMSGHDEEDIEEAGGVPAPGRIMQKPIGLADLRACVDELLQ
jgi:DNA-binding response OmpR family regulator